MKNKWKTIWLFLIAMPFFVSTAGQKTCAAQDAKMPAKDALVFIFDASGSMWGKVKGGRKIEVGKKVLTDLVKNIPDGMQVALTAYGHRREGDCNDVEELVPLSPIEKDKFTKKVKAIIPRGKTPITLSIQRIAERLKYVGKESTVVLISDGRETCEGDPCAEVKKLKERGVRFVIHVIGFAVTENDRKQLECIADAGDGTYYAAKDASALMLAGKKVVEDPKFAAGYLNVVALKDGKPFTAYINIFQAW